MHYHHKAVAIVSLVFALSLLVWHWYQGGNIKYWKQRAASWIFNYLWRDKDSKMAEMIEKNIKARSNAAIMSWLDHRRIQHCKFCPIVDEVPLKVINGEKYCSRHFEYETARLEQVKAETLQTQDKRKLAILK